MSRGGSFKNVEKNRGEIGWMSAIVCEVKYHYHYPIFLSRIYIPFTILNTSLSISLLAFDRSSLAAA